VFLLGLANALLVSGCTITVVNIDDGAYKATWSAGWAPVIQDELPFLASATSPGVCNIGGSQIDCIKTDEKVGADLQGLLDGLTTTSVPSAFSKATDTLEQGLRLEIQGLKDRDAGIIRNGNSLFTHSHDELVQATALIN
jgi:hypothetical protein